MATKKKKIEAKKKPQAVKKTKRGRPKGSKNTKVALVEKKMVEVAMVEFKGSFSERGASAFIVQKSKEIRIMQNGNVIVLPFKAITALYMQCK